MDIKNGLIDLLLVFYVYRKKANSTERSMKVNVEMVNNRQWKEFVQLGWQFTNVNR
jgi:hypothetical protein